MKSEVYIALDIGGTKIMVAAINSKREILDREKVDTPKSLAEGLDLLSRLISSLGEGRQIISIGASAGGPLNHETGVVSPLHFPEWREVPLKKIIEDQFNVPFAVDVDTNTSALAEYEFGGHSSERLLYITLSTGMGGGLIVDGQIYRGEGGSHPEIGHQVVPYKLPVTGPIECLCGGYDCLEAIICGSAIRKHYSKSAEELLPDEWDQVAYNLGQGLRNIITICAPSVIVLGGGMALGGGSRLIEGAMTVLEENVKIVPIPKLRLSKLGYDSSLWGAYALSLLALK